MDGFCTNVVFQKLRQRKLLQIDSSVTGYRRPGRKLSSCAAVRELHNVPGRQQRDAHRNLPPTENLMSFVLRKSTFD